MSSYDKAIEEAAKATSKALDLVKDAAAPIADAYGLLIGDQISAARARRLDALTRKTKKILHDRDVAEGAELAEQIAVPLLQAAQGESREELQDLWAQMLANAMDPLRRNDVRQEYIVTLRQLHPTDILVLTHMRGQPNGRPTMPGQLAEKLGIRQNAAWVSCQRLKANGLLQNVATSSIDFLLTPFGHEFLLACQP